MPMSVDEAEFSAAERKQFAMAKVRKGYRHALAIQDASNMSGLLHAGTRLADAIQVDLGWSGVGVSSDLTSKHPIAVLYASKFHDLCGLGTSHDYRYKIAHEFAMGVGGGSIANEGPGYA